MKVFSRVVCLASVSSNNSDFGYLFLPDTNVQTYEKNFRLHSFLA